MQLQEARQCGACSHKAHGNMVHWHVVMKASEMVCAVGKEHGNAVCAGARMQ